MRKRKQEKAIVEETPLTHEQRIEQLYERLVVRRASELSGLMDLVKSRRNLMWVNFLAGVARGIGFFVGVSLLGAVAVGILAFTFEKTARTLGFRDLTLKQAVRAAYMKFDEIQHDLDEVKAELEDARKEAALHPEEAAPPPDAPPAPDGGGGR